MDKKQELIKKHILKLDSRRTPFICPIFIRKPTYKERRKFDKIKDSDWNKEELYVWSFCRRAARLKIPFKKGDLTHIYSIWGFSKTKTLKAYKKLGETGALNF